MSLRKCFAALFTVLVFQLSSGQEATPVVRLWDKNDHGAANQMWSATCDEDGIMYFGNASGLLSFDSQRWDITPIPGGNIIRSVFYDQGRIYVGSFEEFGYYQQLSDGTLVYTSLSDRLEGFSMNNDEIWTICRLGNRIIFHSFVTLFVYNTSNNRVSPIDTKAFIENIGIDSDGRLLCSADGFSELNPEDGTRTPLPHPWRGRMVAVLPRGNSGDLIITRDEGIYLWKDSALSRWKTDCEDRLLGGMINRAALTSEGDIILGSSLYGCTAIRPNGSKIWSIDASDVLNGNTVLGICENREKDIFLCLDSGIALVDCHSGIRYISSLNSHVGTVYCAQYRAPYLYIGSNQGLYIGMLDRGSLSLTNTVQIKDIKGPVLYLKEIDGQILCGSNTDTYLLSGLRAERLSSDNAGGSCIAKGVIEGQEVLVEGTYTKLSIYKKTGGRWRFSNRVEGFLQPVSSIDIDFTGTVWAGHNSRGLYRIRLDENLEKVTSQTFHPTLDGRDGKIKVKRIGGRSVFYDRTRFYTYNDMTDSIMLYPALNERFGGLEGVVNICEASGRRYWLLTANEAVLMDAGEDRRPLNRISYGLFNSGSVDELKEIKPGPEGWTIMTLNNSLAFIPDGTPSEPVFRPHLTLSRVSVSGNDGRGEENLALDRPLVWNHSSKLVQFTYTYPFYNGIGDKHMEYRLHGRDELFRPAAGEKIDLSHLDEGKYTLEVRVTDNAGEVLDSTVTRFRIRPPLWRSIPAHILYAVTVLAILAYIYLSIRHKIESDRRELENRRLESELNAKSREIASTTMSLINKNKILSDLKEELQVQKNAMGGAYPDKYYHKIISEIDSQISSEQDWQLFQQNFDRIHGDFFKILKSRYPTLTDSDLRFCSYLCMNLSSKEIASMMNISLKGVEAARYRIRKKLALPSEISLSSFLMDLK